MNKIKDQFKVGKHDIVYVSDTFLKEFGNMKLEKGEPLKYTKTIEKYMTGTEVIKKLKPTAVTFGEILATLETDVMSKDGYWNYFYVNKDGIEWLVGAYWDDGFHGQGWRFDADQAETDGVNGGFHLLSRDSFDSLTPSDPLPPSSPTLGTFDPFEFEFSYKGVAYKIVKK